jgi:hypothetical protein
MHTMTIDLTTATAAEMTAERDRCSVHFCATCVTILDATWKRHAEMALDPTVA